MSPQRTKLVGLTGLRLTELEVYRVSEDVSRIIGQMLRVNQIIGPYSDHSRVEFGEVRFLLKLLGVPPALAVDRDSERVELWIAEG